jgi:sarcosine oxidase subunit beta
MKRYDIVIVGAGSVGVPTAYYLARKGKRVAVIEKRSSFGRGENKAAIGGVRATHSDPAKIMIAKMSIEILKNLEQQEGLDVDWLEGGYLFPIYTQQQEKALKELLITQKKYKLNIDWVGPDVIEKLAPGISQKDLRGGTFSPHDGSASPLKVAAAFYKLAFEAGVDFYFDELVKDFIIENQKITTLNTDKDSYRADLVINAAGADAGEIGEKCGLDLPVYPDSHEAGVSEPFERFFQPMIVDIRSDDQSDNYYFYQNKEGQLVFCITPNPKIKGRNSFSTSGFLPLVAKRMLTLYPRLRHMRIRRIWRGLYPMTPDGFPIVGFTRELKNLFLAVGMCGQGFMLGPGLGRIISEILVDSSREYNFLLDQLSLYREFKNDEILK